MSGALRLPEFNHYLDRIAPTPLVHVRLDPAGPTMWCKLEFMNPSGSTKDRIANFILAKALRRGEVRPGSTVVEASSGSTTIAMALACAQMGLMFVTVMPEGIGEERRLIIESYGEEVISHLALRAFRALSKGRKARPSPAKCFCPSNFLLGQDEALDVARRLIRASFPVGPSSGLNFRAALIALDRLRPDTRIVTVSPDRMERYFSTELFRRT